MDSVSEVESQLSRRLRYQEVVADLGQRALEIDDLEQLLHEVTVTVAETLNVDYAKVLELLPGGEEFVLRDGVGWHDERIGETTVPTNPDSQAGYTLGLEEAVIVDDLRTEDRFSGPELLTSHDIVSGVSVLIGTVEEPWGVLGAHTTELREFTEHDAAFVQRVANVLATAVENENAQHRLDEMHTRISDGFYSLDDDWEFTYVNEHAKELIDVTEDGLVGKHIWETFEWAADSRLRDEYEHAMETQEPTTFEFYYPEPLEAWFEVNAYPSQTGLSVYFRDVTERKNQEREHKEHERELELYKTIVETIDDGVYVLDSDQQFSMVNDAYVEMTGYDRDELLGEHCSLVVGEDISSESTQRLHEIVAGEENSAAIEADILRADGSRLRAESNFTAIPRDDGTQPWKVGVVRDVSERVANQRQLQEEKDQLEAAIEAGAVGTWEWRVPEDEMVVGTSFAQTFDIDPDEAREGVPLGQFVEAIHEADRAQVETAVEEAVETCGEYKQEYRVWNSDDDLRWVVARGHVECDEDGNPVTFPGALTDITERKEAEQALHERKAEFRMVAENLDEIIWITSPETMEYQYISPAFDDIWGISRQTVYDDPGSYVQWVHPEDRERVHENFTELPDTALDQEFRVVRPDGDVRWLHVRGEYVESEEGIARVIGIGQDVTQRVEHERKLEESNERLEQFAYAASHDLQEPLRMVSSYLQLLERRYADELDEDARAFIDFAVDGADRMQEMIDGLLEFARVETKGEPFEPVDLGAVLEDVRTDLQLRIEESDAELTADPLPEVYGDSGQLREVMQNLVNNAIEYSGDDPPRIHVSAKRKGSQWCISVRDEGIGIDPTDIDRVFDVFQRLHTREENEGTGIGLAMCQRIVERHGGEIWVDSDPGEGSTFSFTIAAIET